MKIQTRKKNIPIVIIITLILLGIVVGYSTLAYQRNMWPFTTQSDNSDSPALPKVQSRDRAPNQERNTETQDATTETKAEDKTPAQYEGDQISDTPEYNNEQFRIPDSSQ